MWDAALFYIVVVGVAAGALRVGYYAHREQIEPVFGMGERIIIKRRRVMDLPTETHDMVDWIATTYLTMRRKIYVMLGQQFCNGVPAPTEGRVGRHEIYKAPVYAWLPSAAVSSLALVDGFHEAWDGDLLIGSLRERTLFRARIRDDRLVFLETIPIGQRIRDVMQVGPQKIALWLDTEEVVILEIEERVDPLSGLVSGLTEGGMRPDLAEAAHEVLAGCNECHSYEENIHGAGPSLYNVAGRTIASTAFATYSAALKAKQGTWDPATLAAYLADPEAVAEGTAMSGLGLGNPELAEAVATAFGFLNTSAP